MSVTIKVSLLDRDHIKIALVELAIVSDFRCVLDISKNNNYKSFKVQF